MIVDGISIVYLWYIYGISMVYIPSIVVNYTIFKNGKALFLRAIYTMAMLNSQRVYAIIPYYTMPYLGIYGDSANWGSPRWFRMDPKMDHLGCGSFIENTFRLPKKYELELDHPSNWRLNPSHFLVNIVDFIESHCLVINPERKNS